MRRFWCISAAVLAVSGCGESETAEEQPTVFDPLVETLDRARSVQQDIDEHAAEQRRRIEEDEQ